MQVFVSIIFYSCLGLMMLQDYKYREVSVNFMRTFLIASLVLGFIYKYELNEWLLHRLHNSIILIGVFLVLQVYYKLRFNGNGWFIDRIMGLGDLLFFVALSFLFSPINFIFTLCFLSLFSILVAVPLMFRKGSDEKLPLISYMGVGLIIETLTATYCQINCYSDDYFLNQLVYG